MLDDFAPASPRRGDRPVPLGEDGRSPTFCPRCRADGRPSGGLCGECGEGLMPRGYCPTCEAAWKRPIGDPCPKHDQPLEDPPPPTSLGLPGQVDDRWTTVATYGHPNEANAPRIRLEAEGIPTFLDGARVAGSTLYQVATGGARLQVPESLLPAARVILAQVWAATPAPASPDAAASDHEDDDDPWAGLAPEPGSRRRAIMKLAIIAFLLGPALATLGNLCARLLDWVR